MSNIKPKLQGFPHCCRWSSGRACGRMQQKARVSVCALLSCFLVPRRQNKLPACAWSQRAWWCVVSVVNSSCTGWAQPDDGKAGMCRRRGLWWWDRYGEWVRVWMALAGYVQPGTDRHTPAAKLRQGMWTRDEKQLASEGEHEGPRWSSGGELVLGSLLRLLLVCSFTAGLIGWSLGKWEMGQLTPGPMLWEMQREPKTAYRNIFSFLSLVFPDHVQGRILLAVSSASLQKRLILHSWEPEMSMRNKLTRSLLRGLFLRLPGAKCSKECSQICFVQYHRSTGCFIAVNAQYCHMLVQ